MSVCPSQDSVLPLPSHSAHCALIITPTPKVLVPSDTLPASGPLHLLLLLLKTDAHMFDPLLCLCSVTVWSRVMPCPSPENYISQGSLRTGFRSGSSNGRPWREMGQWGRRSQDISPFFYGGCWGGSDSVFSPQTQLPHKSPLLVTPPFALSFSDFLKWLVARFPDHPVNHLPCNHFPVLNSLSLKHLKCLFP
jgi:hypothetical protein